MADFEGFLQRANEARQAVCRMKNPLIINHFDCDGISSGAIVCQFCRENKIKHRVMTVRKLSDETILKAKGEKEIIFADLGGGNKTVNELGGEVVIFDHHQTEGIEKLQLNPHLFGLDGGNEMSGSTCAYWALKTLPEVAIVGAVGDMQYPLVGKNRELMQEFISKGILEAPIDLRFYGRMSRPLVQLLAYADDPYLPFLGGSEERCAQFLDGLKIGRGANGEWLRYSQLKKEQKEKLIGALAAHLAESRGGKYPAQNLVGETYLFPRFEQVPEKYDAGEFSTMLNACGRHNQTEIGIGICLGDEGALEKGKELLAMHKRALREGVDFAYKNIADWGVFLLLDGRGIIDDGIIGVVAGMVFPTRKKAIIALANDETGNVKISTRGTKALVNEGLNLGLGLKEACAQVGGQGGGHAIAAGATVAPQKLDEFLKIFAQILQRQVVGKQKDYEAL